SVPILAIRESTASAIDIIVHLDVLRDGSHRVTKVTEVIGIEEGIVTMQDLFEYQIAYSGIGQLIGHFTATGSTPKFLDRLKGISADFPDSLFQPRAWLV